MPIDYYPQKSADELLALLDGLQKRATVGAVSQVSLLGSQTIKSFQNSGPVSVEIRRILYSLWRRDPSVYSNPYSQRIRRTRPNYTAPTHQAVTET